MRKNNEMFAAKHGMFGISLGSFLAYVWDQIILSFFNTFIQLLLNMQILKDNIKLVYLFDNNEGKNARVF